MPFDPNMFPVPETPKNLKIYSVGNVVPIPPGTTCLFEVGRVTEVNLGKPGGLMLVRVEEVTGN